MNNQHELGIVGLGVMGRNLLLNIGDKGYAVAGYDKDPERVEALQKEAGEQKISGAGSMKEFAGLLRIPRVVMMLVPAGSVVDAVIRDLLPYIGKGDIIIDGGNSHFRDTNLRSRTLAEKGIRYLGVGISGGEKGARNGPSIMPGGPRDAYERVQTVLEAAAAKVGDVPCVTYLGPGSAGHYVKMVHNGIEYGLIQLIAETYDLMRRGLGLSNDELHAVYDRWNGTELNSFLIEITSRIFRHEDEKTGKRLIDVILDEAKQKGTGKWTCQDAMDLQVPVPTIDMAVSMRDMSVFKEERQTAGKIFEKPRQEYTGDREVLMNQLQGALHVAMTAVFAQGLALLRKASDAYDYNLNLEDVARIWRGGCIIRAALLDDIMAAYGRRPDLPNILLDPGLSREVLAKQEALRSVVFAAAHLGIPMPGLMSSLSYFDAYRSPWLPANLIQAQRDYFGAHTYERVDEKGTFHTQWSEG